MHPAAGPTQAAPAQAGPCAPAGSKKVRQKGWTICKRGSAMSTYRERGFRCSSSSGNCSYRTCGYTHAHAHARFSNATVHHHTLNPIYYSSRLTSKSDPRALSRCLRSATHCRIKEARWGSTLPDTCTTGRTAMRGCGHIQTRWLTWHLHHTEKQ